MKKGTKHTEETRAKMRETHANRPRMDAEELSAKLRAAWRARKEQPGGPVSDETRAKMRAAWEARRVKRAALRERLIAEGHIIVEQKE